MPPEAATTSAQATTNADAKPNETVVVPPTEAAAKPPEAPVEAKTLVTGLESEAKASDAKPTEPPAKDDKPVVPEKYELKLSEKSQLSQANVDALSAYAKEKGMSNEQAQELLSREEQAVGGFVKGLHDNLAARQTEWVNAVKNDKEMGGDNFKEAVHYSHQFVKKFGNEAIMKELELSGLGNHPEV